MCGANQSTRLIAQALPNVYRTLVCVWRIANFPQNQKFATHRLAIPEFTSNETKNVVTLGDLKVQATEPTSHSVPPIVSGAAIIIGLVLIGSGLYRKS